MHQYEFENLINSNLPKYITDRITFKDIMRVANVLEYSGNLDNAVDIFYKHIFSDLSMAPNASEIADLSNTLLDLSRELIPVSMYFTRHYDRLHSALDRWASKNLQDNDLKLYFKLIKH